MRFPFSRKKETETELFATAKKSQSVRNAGVLKSSALASAAMQRCAQIISRCPERKAGSEESRQAARMLHEAFSDVSDDCVITSFRSNEGRYSSIFRLISAASVLMTVLCWLDLSFFALVTAAIVSFITVHDYMLCLKNNDSRARGSDFTNVHAVIEPEEDAESTIIFTSHHDSARMLSSGRGEGNSLIMSLHVPLVHFIVLALASFCLFVNDLFSGGALRLNLPPLSMGILLALLTLCLPFQWKLFNLVTDECSPGAGDNLISSCILTETAHYFKWRKDNEHGLKNIRLVFASFDGEECGLKGSEDWYRRYAGLCRNASVINLDCPLRLQDLCYITKDVNGFVPLSGELAAELAQASEMMGYKSRTGSLSLFSGATDAASAARAGLKAVTLMCMMPGGPGSDVIHTTDDTLENLDKKTVEAVISICIKFVLNRAGAEENVEERRPSALEDTARKLTISGK